MAEPKGHKGAILVQKKGETIKWFRYWHDADKAIAQVEITWKDDDGEKQSVMKEYKATKNKVTVTMLVEAVIKYWPRYNPQIHDLVTSSGHKHGVKKKA